MDKRFPKNTLAKRIKSMLAVDFRRMFTTPRFYIILAICLVVPVLILVMTTMMDGSVSVDPNTGKETVMKAYDSAWQIIGSVGSGESASMDMMSMLNIDMLYFAVAVLVSMFVADDFRSGYAKNLFTVRAKKTDYVISKLTICSIGAELMLLAYFVGTMIGGAVAGLPFTMMGFSLSNLIMCIWSKIMLVPIFASIYLCMSVIGKQKLWMSMLLSLMVGMFLFNIASIAAPMNATILNVFICTIGSILFGIGLGAVSNKVLSKTSLV